MNSKRLIVLARWIGAALGLAAIVAFYDEVVHVNSTTVALTFLLFILFLATQWGLRYAVITSMAATACYNFFFLPPLHTFTVADPQNLVALFVLLITSIVASRMSERIRDESRAARLRQAELQMLYSLSRELLQTEELSVLTNSVPAAVATVCRARSALFYLMQGDKVYRHGAAWPTNLGTSELHALAQSSAVSRSVEASECVIPLRTGVRPRGVLLLRGILPSTQTLEAIGGLVSLSLDRARAVENVTRAEAAKESERLRTMMMDSITHEIRSPLTAIKVSISTLRTMELSEVGTSDLLAVIDEETDRLNQLVAQSVEMAQLDTLEVSMSLTPQTLSHLIDLALQATANIVAGRELTITLPPDLSMIDADPIWLPRLIGNLLENAAKYSRADQPIFISAEPRGEMIACSVADRGIGIDPMEQSLIFDKFYRSGDRAAYTPGTGMGLAICRAIVEAHNGTMSVTSQPGQGSVFTFTVRASQQQARPSSHLVLPSSS